MPDIDITHLVAAVRNTLEETDGRMRVAGQAPLFELDGFDLELKFTVAGSTERKGGLDLKVVSYGGAAGVKTEEVQTLTIRYRVAKEAAERAAAGTRAHVTAAKAPQQDIDPL